MSDLTITAAGELLTPEGAQYKLAVRVDLAGDLLKLATPSRVEDFVPIAWRLGFSWQNYTWQRSGSLDLAVEVAHILLENRFPLRVPCENLRQRILAGDYTPEVTRQIRLIKQEPKEGWYMISWCRQRDGSYYKRSTKLSGAQWSKDLQSVVVPPDAADEIENFAQLYGFTISKAAQKALDARRATAVETLRLKINTQKGKKQPPPVGQVDESLVDESLVDEPSEERDA